MKNFKKKIQLLGYVIMIILVSMTAGIGGAPIPMRGRKDEHSEIKIERIDTEETESEEEEAKK